MNEKPAAQTVTGAATEAFEKGFYANGVLRPEHTDETQLKLAYALVPSGIGFGQLNALALAVRAVGDLEPFALEGAITPKQQAAYAALLAEKAMPAPFKELLQAALPKLQQRRDLYALYGVPSGTMDKISAMANTMRISEQLAKATRP